VPVHTRANAVCDRSAAEARRRGLHASMLARARRRTPDSGRAARTVCYWLRVGRLPIHRESARGMPLVWPLVDPMSRWGDDGAEFAFS
jgi:hypothetical protein